MSAIYTGKCVCEGIRFSISTKPALVLACSCTHCQKGAGGPSSVMGFFAEDSIDVLSGKDLISTYVITNTDSGKPKDKMFCKVCGVTVWTSPFIAKERKQLLVRTAVLDGYGPELKPTVEVYTKGKPTWATAVEGAAQHEHSL
ncbi:Mss4-like protein [Podospora australis]|uniref:Mss4-like protein n=1 Tax=Podospora australis TaxID=1536484 RepID=A0AAN6WJI7_9PEZI|nr:Mss4-like protein [Podospora australis]